MQDYNSTHELLSVNRDASHVTKIYRRRESCQSYATVDTHSATTSRNSHGKETSLVAPSVGANGKKEQNRLEELDAKIEARRKEDELGRHNSLAGTPYVPEFLPQAQEAAQEVPDHLGELDAKIEAMQHTGIIRPKWSVGLTNQEVAAVAKHEGLNPYRPDWYDGLDPVVICEARSGCFRHGPRETLTSLKQERKRIMAEQYDTEYGQIPDPRNAELDPNRSAYAIPVDCKCACACDELNHNLSGVCDECLAGNHVYPGSTDSTPTPETSISVNPEAQKLLERFKETSSSGERTPGSSQSGQETNPDHIPMNPAWILTRTPEGKEMTSVGFIPEFSTRKTPSKRIRINVSTTTKGVKTWDCTLEMEGASIEEALAESDKLVAELESRYPVKE